MLRLNRIVIVAVAATGMAATAGYAVSAQSSWRSVRAATTFTIGGHVEGLYPGARSRLAVRVRNPWSRPIRVTSVSARVGPSGRTCPVGNVRIGSFRGSLLVRPRSSRLLFVTAALSMSAPNACQGAVFPLRFHGNAIRR